MKQELTARRKIIQEEISSLRKKSRQAAKENKHATVHQLDRKIEALEKQKKVYYGTRVEPVQFANGFVLNGSLLKQFVKKLPSGIHLEASFTEDVGMIDISHKHGKLSLYNLAEHYQGFKMPKGEELLDELGIVLN